MQVLAVKLPVGSPPAACCVVDRAVLDAPQSHRICVAIERVVLPPSRRATVCSGRPTDRQSEGLSTAVPVFPPHHTRRGASGRPQLRPPRGVPSPAPLPRCHPRRLSASLQRLAATAGDGTRSREYFIRKRFPACVSASRSVKLFRRRASPRRPPAAGCSIPHGRACGAGSSRRSCARELAEEGSRPAAGGEIVTDGAPAGRARGCLGGASRLPSSPAGDAVATCISARIRRARATVCSGSGQPAPKRDTQLVTLSSPARRLLSLTSSHRRALGRRLHLHGRQCALSRTASWTLHGLNVCRATAII